MTDLDLAEEFRLLAEDRYWPCNCRMESCATMRQLKIAQLALMVVDEIYKRCGSVNWVQTLHDTVLKSQKINPSHYANVKERLNDEINLSSQNK